MRILSPGFEARVETLGAAEWSLLLQEFADANLFQTWPFAAVSSGPRNVTHLVLKKGGQAAAIAAVRLARLPLLGSGIAYIRWGPLWRRRGAKEDEEVYRQALRALRHEFSLRRGLTVRLLPGFNEAESLRSKVILEEEGFISSPGDTTSRTILMDIQPPVEELRDGMNAHWKRELKLAEKKGLRIIEGTGDDLFESFHSIYKEMLARKNFEEGASVDDYRLVQQQLPESLRMGIMLCEHNGEACSGVVWSRLGTTAIYLFGATSNSGMKSNGSYLLHWELIKKLKNEGCLTYDLNGINPETNPGTYKFKKDLAGKHGRDVRSLGVLESPGGLLSRWSVSGAEKLRLIRRSLGARSAAWAITSGPNARSGLSSSSPLS